MSQRRAFLGAVAAPLVCAWPAVAQGPTGPRRRSSRGPEFFPNVLLRTHEDQGVRFYDDVIKGKVIGINFMFTRCTAFCPRATANLRRVHELLGERFGRDVFFASISLDPETDSPAVLKEYVAANRIGPGWSFLTGSPSDIEQIRRKLGVWDDGRDMAEHTGLLTYGNDATGSWGATPVINKPSVIAATLRRLSLRAAATNVSDTKVSLDTAKVR